MTDICTIKTIDYIAAVDESGKVTYTDNPPTREQAIEYIKAHLDEVPEQVRPIVAWAMSEPCRKVLLRKGGIGEEWFFAFSVRRQSARAELAKHGTVNDLGQFFFNYDAKKKALAWLKAGCRTGKPGFTKSNAKYYAVDLGPLGIVIVEKPRRNYGDKPWIVRYRLQNCKPTEPYFLSGYIIPRSAFGA